MKLLLLPTSYSSTLKPYLLLPIPHALPLTHQPSSPTSYLSTFLPYLLPLNPPALPVLPLNPPALTLTPPVLPLTPQPLASCRMYTLMYIKQLQSQSY